MRSMMVFRSMIHSFDASHVLEWLVAIPRKKQTATDWKSSPSHLAVSIAVALVFRGGKRGINDPPNLDKQTRVRSGRRWRRQCMYRPHTHIHTIDPFSDIIGLCTDNKTNLEPLPKQQLVRGHHCIHIHSDCCVASRGNIMMMMMIVVVDNECLFPPPP
jgi:hypothetical protein